MRNAEFGMGSDEWGMKSEAARGYCLNCDLFDFGMDRISGVRRRSGYEHKSYSEHEGDGGLSEL